MAPSNPSSFKRKIRDGLAAATYTLIGINAADAEVPSIDTAVLYYTEFDRVSVMEGVVSMRKEIGDSRFLNLKLVFDTLTGASANGAAPSNDIQTFTRPSGRGTYTIQPGETPLDDTFRDTRFAGNAGIELPLSRLTLLTAGGSFSTEYDYQSMGLNATVARDFDRRNTTVLAGLSIASDIIDPEGGPPIPFASMQQPGVHQPKERGTKDKTVVDVLLGLTQVIDRETVAQLNYSYSRSSGYLTDPFKLLSVVDPTPGSSWGEPVDFVYEARPEIRVKHSVSGKLKRHMGEGVADISYRFMRDDWGIRSHTVELSYHRKLGDSRFIEPQGRFYHQSAADFYRHSLTAGDPFPHHATADYRLGEFNAATLALKFGGKFLGGKKISLRIGYYLQMGDSSPPDAIGIQKELDLFPNVGAAFVQLSSFFSR